MPQQGDTQHTSSTATERMQLPTAGEANSFPLRYKNRTLYVVAGRANGVIEGTEFTIQLAITGEVGSRDVVLVAKTVHATECIVRHDEIPDLTPYVEALKKTRAVISAWIMKAMKVRTSVPLPKEARFSYEKATPKGYYDLSLQPELVDHWIFTRSDPLTFRYADPEITAKGCPLQPDEILDTIAHWNFHLYCFNDRAGGREELRPQVQLHACDYVTPRGASHCGIGEERLLSPTGADLLGFASAEDVRGCPLSTYKHPVKVKEARIHDFTKYYGLTLINTSTYDLYPYVFYFEPSTYSIEAWYLPDYEPTLRRGQSGVPGELAIGYGARVDNAIRFSLDSRVKRDAGFLKIFVSTSYVDMMGLERRGLSDNPRGSFKPVVTMPPGGAWDASVYVLTCISPD